MATTDIICFLIIFLSVISFWYVEPLFAVILLACGIGGLYQTHKKKQNKVIDKQEDFNEL